MPPSSYPLRRDILKRRFPNDDACADYLEQLRWPEGFECPMCGSRAEPWRESRRRLGCRQCGKQTSVTSGTIFDNTRTPLTSWFHAAWVFVEDDSVSAWTAAERLGLRYRVVWGMLQRYRAAMARSLQDPLSGVVELAYSKLDIEPTTAQPAAVLIAYERSRRSYYYGRIRVQHVGDEPLAYIPSFANGVAKNGTTLVTTAFVPSAPVEKLGYKHEATLKSAFDPREVSVARAPCVYRVARELQHWIRPKVRSREPVPQGAYRSIEPHHLPAYLAHFAYLFEHHGERTGRVWRRLLYEAVRTPPVRHV